MKEAPTIEIRVALVGDVNAGKTTLLNAIMSERFGEVRRTRTTAAVNFFRVSVRPGELVDTSFETKGPVVTVDKSAPGWSKFPEEPHSIHAEIAVDNEILREGEVVHERFFELEVKEPLCEMFEAAKLVVVDIPGINEAKSASKYKKYVEDNWNLFDCVVAVMDGNNGANAEEQLEFLRFIKKNRDTYRKIPVIILCNKVDDGEDRGQEALIRELRDAIRSTFQMPEDWKSVEQIITGAVDMEDPYPLFFSVSALHAFIYRSAACLGLEEFAKLGDLIDEIGRAVYGRVWKRLSAEERLKKAYEEITDPESYNEGIKTSNFTTFLEALSFCVGGKTNQCAILSDQIRVLESKLETSRGVGFELDAIHSRCVALGEPTDRLGETFWEIHQKTVSHYFGRFKFNSIAPVVDINPMDQILSFVQYAKENHLLSDEKERIIFQAKALVCQQISFVLDYHHGAEKGLTPYDWKLIYGSMLSAASNKHFYEILSLEKILLEGEYQKVTSRCEHGLCPKQGCCAPLRKEFQSLYCSESCTYFVTSSTTICPHCAMTNEVKHAIPVDGSRCIGCHRRYECVSSFESLCPKYRLQGGRLQLTPDTIGLVRIQVPEKISDPRHFGHFIWMFGRIMEEIDCWEFSSGCLVVSWKRLTVGNHREVLQKNIPRARCQSGS